MSAPTPASASDRARAATPSGKVNVGRSRTPVRCTVHSSGRLITATPAVVPQPSRATAASATAAGSSFAPGTIRPNAMKTPITTALLSTGASPAPVPRRRAGPGAPQRGRDGARSRALAGVGALIAQQVSVLAALATANGYGGVGTWPVFGSTQAVYLLPYAVLAFPLATATLPRLAERAARDDVVGFATLTSRTTRAVLLVSGVGAAALVAVAPAVQAVQSARQVQDQ